MSQNNPRPWLRPLCIYALLMGGSAIFMWPFLWMAMTSFKLDREMFSDSPASIRLLPQRPVPQLCSPYIDRRFLADVTGPRMNELLPVIEAHLWKMNYAWPKEIDKSMAIQQCARGIYKKLVNILPAEVFAGSPTELSTAISAYVNSGLVDQVWDQIRRRLSLGVFVVQSYDVRQDILVPGDKVAENWKINGRNASLIPINENGKAAADLHYDFSSDNTVRFSQTFQTSFPVAQLHRLQLSLRSDDSWAGVTVYIEKLGKRYKSERPLYLADFNWLTGTWQEPGPDDATNKIKSWILLREESGADGISTTDPHQLKVIFEIKKNTAVGAWLAKIWLNYRLTFDHVPFWRYVGTSLFLVILNVVLTLFSCSLVAYSFARLQWPGRAFCFALMLATMMIPGQVTMIPHFLIIRSFGWYNTLYPLWVPSLFANAFNVFLLRQFLKGIPRDLEDAARIDGCGFMRVYWHLMLPFVRPTLAAIGIFTFMATWNDFMGPLIYLSDQRLYPLSLGLFALNVQLGGGSMGILTAGSLLMTLPVITIFFFAQRYFLQGITLTGMK